MKESARHTLVGFFSILAGLVMLIWFVYALFHASAAFQSGVIAVIGVVTAGILTHRYAKQREVAARHFETKRAAYTEFIDLTVQMLTANRLNQKSPTNLELASAIVNFKKSLLTWADAEVIKTWIEIEGDSLDTVSQGNPAKSLFVWDRLWRALRKDLGKDDSKLADGDLVALFLNAEGRADLEKIRSN